MTTKSFASDNNSGIHPQILNAIANANLGHSRAYGHDPITAHAEHLFKELFGQSTSAFFVFNGTAANVTGLSAVMNSWNSVICTTAAHINEDECGAPEKFLGSKLFDVFSPNAKLNLDSINHVLAARGDEHRTQHNVISITQATEFGTVYTLPEIKEIAGFAHANGLLLHMDGARISNAAVSLGMNFRDFTVDAGVDIVSFGGTKNGLMLGEAVLIFNPEIAENMKYIRKQSMQLASKMRFISAQFIAYLEQNIWFTNASHANAMAQLLASLVADIPGLKLAHPVQANGVFVCVPPEVVPVLQEKYYFYIFDEVNSVARWMCSFDTTENEVREFASFVAETMDKYVSGKI